MFATESYANSVSLFSVAETAFFVMNWYFLLPWIFGNKKIGNALPKSERMAALVVDIVSLA